MNARLKSHLFLFGAAVSLMIPAVFNGYPLVYSDTATYLDSGFTLEMPFDRPLTYGLFLRISSLNGLTLWTVIGLQCLLLAYLIFRLVREILTESRTWYFYGFVIVLSLSLLTGISWTASQLMPDIFTPIMFLTAILLITGRLSRREQLFLYLLFFLSAAMHLSHIAFNVAFLTTVLIAREVKLLKLKSVLKISPMIILLTLSLATIFITGSALSKSRHIFLMAAFVEHGIVKQYLDENCATKDYKLCAYKDSLPEFAWQFLWVESGPLQKMGGRKETKQEFNQIIKATFTSPRFIAIHIRESLKATASQLVRFNIGDGNGSFPEGTKLHERMGLFVPHELNAYETSRQNQSSLVNLPWIIRLHQVVVAASLLSLVLLFAKTRKVPPDHLFTAICTMVLLGILINAWTCGTFANAIDRLGTKIIWFIPLLAVLSLNLIRKLH
ncbi:MAG: hypothetical protein KAR16_09800 [Bacteroidales bacterium]|nr:hypothetical protein [Bacteroidales bacterium]